MKDAATQLTIRERNPLNAEPDPARLVRNLVTPVDDFYIRNHGNVPRIEEQGYRLRVSGLVEKEQNLSLSELKSYRTFKARRTLQCAGNRRTEHEHFEGTPWHFCALGTADWTGVLLRDVLARCGIKDGVRHIHFIGLDQTEMDSQTHPYGVSLPLVTALEHDTLLAWGMNGQPLTPEHGFPLRAVVPGLIAARSVKWLGAIELSKHPSDNPHFTQEYKMAPPDSNGEVAWEEFPPIQEYQLTSAVCDPPSGADLKPGRVNVRGYAVPEGRQNVVVERVEVKVDGEEWREARIVTPRLPFSWCLWESEVELEVGDHRISVRAWDSTGRLQPETSTANPKGYLYTGWHFVNVTVSV